MLLAYWALAWLVGHYAGPLEPTNAKLVFAGALVVAWFYYWFRRVLTAYSWRVALGAIFFVLGAAHQSPKAQLSVGRDPVLAIATVLRSDYSPVTEGKRAVLAIDAFRPLGTTGKSMSPASGAKPIVCTKAALNAGATVRIAFTPSRTRRALTLLGTELRSHCDLDVDTISFREINPPTFVRHAMSRVRQRALRDVYAAIEQPVSGILAALVLGQRADLARDFKETFVSAGLAHLLAISGLHIGILSLLLYRLIAYLMLMVGARRAWVDPARYAAWLCIPLTLFSAELCGGSASAWRAATMITLAFLARGFGRRADPLAILGLSMFLLPLLEPRWSLSLGFLMSVLATASLVTVFERAHSFAGMFRAVWRPWLATLPLTTFLFQELSLGALIANLCLLPIAVAIWIPLAFLATGSASFGVEWPAYIFSYVTRAIWGLTDAIAAVLPRVTLNPLSEAQFVTTIYLSAVVLADVKPKVRGIALGAGIVFFIFLEAGNFARPGRGELWLDFIDVGQGDATLLRFDDGTKILIDAGPADGGWRAHNDVLKKRASAPRFESRSALERALARARIDKLDVVAITHAHPDHYAGLLAIVGKVEVEALWLNAQGFDELPASFRDEITRVSRRWVLPAELCGNPRYFGQERSRVELIAPCPSYDPARGLNDNSLVIRIVHNGRRVLLTGDIERKSERALVASQADLKADILKVPHHGSRTSSLDAFIDRVQPTLALIGVGLHNAFGHPHAEVMARYKRRGITVRTTARSGDLSYRITRYGYEQR